MRDNAKQPGVRQPGAVALMTMVIVWGVLPAVLLRAFVLTCLWGWYVVPFFGVASLRLSVAYGFLLIMSFCAPFSHRKAEDKELGTLIGMSFIYPFFVLLFGWLGSLFV